MRQHLRRDVSSYRHNGAVAGLRFGQFSDGVVPQIVEAQASKRTLHVLEVSFALGVYTSIGRRLMLATCWALNQASQIPPCRAPARLWPRRIEMRCFTRWEDIMLRSN